MYRARRKLERICANAKRTPRSNETFLTVDNQIHLGSSTSVHCESKRNKMEKLRAK